MRATRSANSRCWALRKRRGGVALLEMALVAPVLILVTFGVAEWGLMFSRYQVLLNGARVGARAASMFRPECVAADVAVEVEAAVLANTTTLGMTSDDISITVTDQCQVFGAAVVSVEFEHTLDLISGFIGLASVPLDAEVMMRNESSGAP